ncbi:tetratricopeptide repeat protein [Mycolicibacterium vinylchloridicum]|uniref:hypothetical protein n=1 Tax=Mycolicibacterium vinylchloridicum TaxID=2736928 RepID=UPI0015CC144C|nr:hypothetical protein [Mycolicibacterium vinylchloridicum]
MANPSPHDGTFGKWVMIGVVIVLVGCGAWYAWGYFQAKGQLAAISTRDNDHSTSAPSNTAGLTLDAATPSQFDADSNFTDAERQQWAVEQLQAPSRDPDYPNMTVLEAAHQRLNANLKKNNRMPLEELTGSQLVEPALSNTANESNLLRTLVVAAAAYAKDLPTAKKMLAAAYDNVILDNPHAYVMKSFGKTFTLSRTERRQQDVQVTFTSQDISKITGQMVEFATPVDPTAATPSRITLQMDTQDLSGRPLTEEQESFINNRWVITSPAVTSSDAGWIEPTKLSSAQPK